MSKVKVLSLQIDVSHLSSDEAQDLLTELEIQLDDRGDVSVLNSGIKEINVEDYDEEVEDEDDGFFH